MTPMIDTLAAIAAYPLRARSLFLWHQMLGPDCGAAQRLREMAATIAALPAGSDIADQRIAIRPQPAGFDIQEAALPNADVLFAGISQAGLGLVLSSTGLADGRSVRRLRVLDAQGALYRRRGAERFLLRYRLSPAILACQDVVLLSIVHEAGVQEIGSHAQARRPARLPPLHAWIELARGGERQFIEVAETSAAVLGDEEVARLASFAAGALPDAAAQGGITGVHLYLELTGETIDLQLYGETLLV